MKCAAVRALLASDYVDGELDPRARAGVDRHLDACGGCTAYAEAVRRDAVEPFRGAPLERAPEAVWAGVRREIARGEGRGIAAALGRAWGSLRAPACAAASVAAAAAVALLVFRPGPPAPKNGGAQFADSEEIQAYFQEQWANLARNDGGAQDLPGDPAAADGRSQGGYGTLVEKYLI
jgi:anti-sigma factor RsiW